MDVITLAQRGGHAFWRWFANKRRLARVAPVLGRYRVSLPASTDTTAAINLARIYGGRGDDFTLTNGTRFAVVGDWLRLKAGVVLVAGTQTTVLTANPRGPGQTVALRAFVLTITS